MIVVVVVVVVIVYGIDLSLEKIVKLLLSQVIINLVIVPHHVNTNTSSQREKMNFDPPYGTKHEPSVKNCQKLFLSMGWNSDQITALCGRHVQVIVTQKP